MTTLTILLQSVQDDDKTGLYDADLTDQTTTNKPTTCS